MNPDITPDMPGNDEKPERYDKEIENWFTYHPPTGPVQVKKYELIRDTAKELAYVIRIGTPSGPDQTVALRKLRECVFTANAAIACGE